ncbi:nuclear transport factor 2 family protein [Paraburkholderia sp. CNPSo 3272]|uniref:nuclear transport factor 2 family protein n=1 Tax=Paraburkholderia sp. CNPSo 3272 TaxID=2940931 RepID=UPI0020B72A3E|nr:nuclear transport factor 2 family protein [Paraburkholderia sp. CNPSo 3272]MCP3728120.1 nuclear transport factor 2 family protein [Paraburkholderia sp. CNPSo 3272]
MNARKSGFSRRTALIAVGAGVAVGLASKAMAAGTDETNSTDLANAVEILRRALVDGDGETLTKLAHDDLTYSHSDGRVWTKRDLLENIAGKKRYLEISVSSQTVSVVKQTGIVRHTYDVVNNLGDGKTSSSHIKVLMCWIKSGKNWQLLARSGTTVPA